MSRRRRVGLVAGVGALALLAVALLLMLRASPSRAAEPAGGVVPPGGAETHGEAEVSSRGHGDMRSPAREGSTRHLAGSILELHILDGHGRTAHGDVYWTTSQKPPSHSSRLSPGYGQPLPAGAQHLSHEGEARLVLPQDQWTWARVTARRPSGEASAYLRIAPFEGRRYKEVVVRADRRSLHVWVLQSDLIHPAARAQVRLFRLGGAGAGGGPQLLASAQTDASGYVAFADLDPGGFLLCAPGAEPGDKAPYTAGMMLPRVMPVNAMAVTLAIPPARELLRLVIQASFDADKVSAPKLFLERMDGGVTKRLFPVPGLLQPGIHEVRMRVPAGAYVVRGLPLGVVVVSAATRSFLVAKKTGATAQISVTRSSRSTKVQLHGLERQDFPVNVDPRPLAWVQDDEPELLFCGPYHWYKATETIATPAAPCRFVVHGRNRWWIARATSAFGVGPVKVGLVPACRLEVRWLPEDLVAQRGTVIDVWSSAGQDLRVMTRRLVLSGGATRTALTAKIVVPQGHVKIECRAREGARLAWRRELEVKRDIVRLEVEGRGR